MAITGGTKGRPKVPIARTFRIEINIIFHKS
jgi:hypothetical protein